MLKQVVARRFARAAPTYDGAARIQKQTAARLAALLAGERRQPAAILEVGCGTGFFTERLRALFPGASFYVSDLAAPMVRRCRARLSSCHYLVMDAEAPAVRGPFDLVCANLAAQWFADLPAALAGLAKLLAPDGLLAVSLLGERTFREWRAAHVRLGLTAGARRFPSREEIASAFPTGGELSLQGQLVTERFADGLAFLRALRALGADAPTPGHAPLSAGQMRRVLREFSQAPLVAYEIIYALWRKR